MKFLITVFILVLDLLAAEAAIGRIYNGANATVGEFTYQAAIEVRSASATTFCSGVLISRTFVLTAAHCLEETEESYIMVRLGNTSHSHFLYNLIVERSDVIIHENWNNSNVDDIALLRIPRIKYGATVKHVLLPLCAPPCAGSKFVNHSAIATGWGADSGQSTVVRDLEWVRLKVISNKKCSRLLRYHPIHDNDICAETVNGGSPCLGDSGGPLVDEKTGLLLGVLSSTQSYGCNGGVPAVYKRITAYLPWILTHANIAI